MKLIATRSDGAELYYTRTEQREFAFGKPIDVDMGVIVIDGEQFPERDIPNLTKFSNDWTFLES
jgi:hypothetical protein